MPPSPAWSPADARRRRTASPDQPAEQFNAVLGNDQDVLRLELSRL